MFGVLMILAMLIFPFGLVFLGWSWRRDLEKREKEVGDAATKRNERNPDS
jgi:hypothetical protein